MSELEPREVCFRLTYEDAVLLDQSVPAYRPGHLDQLARIKRTIRAAINAVDERDIINPNKRRPLDVFNRLGRRS